MLRRLWKGWRVIAQKIGDFQARLILGLLYLLLVGPIALLRRLAVDPLGTRPTPGPSYWRSRPPGNATLDAARRQ